VVRGWEELLIEKFQFAIDRIVQKEKGNVGLFSVWKYADSEIHIGPMLFTQGSGEESNKGLRKKKRRKQNVKREWGA